MALVCIFVNLLEHVAKWGYSAVGLSSRVEQKLLKRLLAYGSRSHLGYTQIAFSIGLFKTIETVCSSFFIGNCGIVHLVYIFSARVNKKTKLLMC